MRWLVQFGYDGRPFAGWARQPGLRTVEGELLRGLSRLGIVPPAGSAGLAVASRTDRGVSARANAFVITADLPGGALLRSLNGISPEVTCTAATEVSEEFRVRRAVRRTYRYFVFQGDHDIGSWERAARLFQGTIDVRSFGRALPAGAPVERVVETVTIQETTGGFVVEVRAPSFVWGMVRKIVAALREHDSGRLPLARLEAAVRGRERLTLPLAPPEGLVLWEVEYPFPWNYHWAGPNRHQRARSQSLAESFWVHSHVLKAITEV